MFSGAVTKMTWLGVLGFLAMVGDGLLVHPGLEARHRRT